MKSRSVRALVVCLALIAVAAVVASIIRRHCALTNGGNYHGARRSVTENFDTLISSGSATCGQQRPRFRGWYHARDRHWDDDRGATRRPTIAGSLYSYGVSTPSTDRALGSIGSGSALAGLLLGRATDQRHRVDDHVAHGQLHWRTVEKRRSRAGANRHASAVPASAPISAMLLRLRHAGNGRSPTDFTSPIPGAPPARSMATLRRTGPRIGCHAHGSTIANGQEILLRWL